MREMKIKKQKIIQYAMEESLSKMANLFYAKQRMSSFGGVQIKNVINLLEYYTIRMNGKNTLY